MGNQKAMETREIIDRLPYVTSLNLPSLCEGWITMDGRRKRCPNNASWKFQKSSSQGVGRAKSGWFCTGHIIMTLKYSKYEMARAQRAYEKANKEKSNDN
jgi:hypothetical protein